MKTKPTRLLLSAGIAAAALVYFGLPPREAAAQPAAVAGTPPVNRLVDVTLVASLASTVAADKISGTLLSMTGEWIVVKEGSFEHWIPKEKVLVMKATR